MTWSNFESFIHFLSLSHQNTVNFSNRVKITKFLKYFSTKLTKLKNEEEKMESGYWPGGSAAVYNGCVTSYSKEHFLNKSTVS